MRRPALTACCLRSTTSPARLGISRLQPPSYRASRTGSYEILVATLGQPKTVSS